MSPTAISLRYRLSSRAHAQRAGRAAPGRSGQNAPFNKNRRRGALQRDSGSLMQIKQQAPNRIFRIKTLHCRSLSGSTAAPQTCRRSPSPSRTQHSLPSKVKQINPHILTYPRPFSSHKNDTNGSLKKTKHPENTKLSVLHKKRSRYIRICILEGGCCRNVSVPTCYTCNQSLASAICQSVLFASRFVRQRYHLVSPDCHFLEASALFKTISNTSTYWTTELVPPPVGVEPSNSCYMSVPRFFFFFFFLS